MSSVSRTGLPRCASSSNISKDNRTSGFRPASRSPCGISAKRGSTCRERPKRSFASKAGMRFKRPADLAEARRGRSAGLVRRTCPTYAPADDTGSATKTGGDFSASPSAPPLLLLPNAWDAMSARQFEAAGFGAIATTSGGLAWALGFPDGERAPWPEVVAATARIVRVVRVPVTADIEAGYGETPEQVG